MKRDILVFIALIFLQIQRIAALIDPITLGIVGGIGMGLYGLSNFKGMIFDKCKTEECCDEKWIPISISGLNNDLYQKLHGQQIARATVINALRGYYGAGNNPKALAMSFHGLPGSGKNFVAKMIADRFYKKGTDSQYYHFFNGRTFAPNKHRLEYYKEQIREIIAESLLMCEKSMFVFDEVDMMPEGLLNVLVPFLDYVDYTSVDLYGTRVRVITNEAIFIFLSNTGSAQIMQQMMKFWTEGVDRNTRTLKDFEHLIAVGAFNEKGGFQKSDTIRTNLIDYYVPFLPLEEEHVKKCMKDAFLQRRTGKPSQEMEEEVLSVVTYGPEPHNIYAKSGCKKIEQKVISVVYQYQHYN